MSRLFDIQQTYLQMMEEIEENQGEFTHEMEEALAINEEDLHHKALNYRRMIKHWEGEIAAATDEKKRIDSYIKTRKNGIDRLKDSVDSVLKARGMSELDFGVDGKFSFRKSTSVEVDEDNLPASKKYWNIKKIPNKTIIGQLLKVGKVIKGAKLVEKQNLQVK